VSLMEHMGPNFHRDQNGMHSQLLALSKVWYKHFRKTLLKSFISSRFLRGIDGTALINRCIDRTVFYHNEILTCFSDFLIWLYILLLISMVHFVFHFVSLTFSYLIYLALKYVVWFLGNIYFILVVLVFAMHKLWCSIVLSLPAFVKNDMYSHLYLLHAHWFYTYESNIMLMHVQLVELLDRPLHVYLKEADCLNYFFCFRWLLIQFKRWLLNLKFI
jgi:hypothetical protein